MDLGLQERTALVLASTGGLGRAVAASLLGEGARVLISGRDPQRLGATLEELGALHPGRVEGQCLDVTDGPALSRWLQEAEEQHGIDVLVLNAGGPPPAGALDVTHAGLDAAWELTMHSAVRAVQGALPGMRARGWGRIVAMTSLTVRHPNPSLVYSNVVRVGLTAYLKTLADEVARDGVLVNSVCTGMFDTERLEELFEARAAAAGTSPADERARAVATIPVGRTGRPEEFGDFVAFLCSERASFVNGAALPLDGGAGRFLL